MADRPDLIDPLPDDETIPGDDVPEVNDPLLPDDPEDDERPL